MSLKCSFKKCLKFDLAQFHQIAFYQDIITNGWNLALGPEFLITGTEIPKNIRLVGTGDERFPYNVICVNCLSKVGTVNSISGFNQMTANFSRNKVVLMDMDTKNQTKKQKWSKIIDAFPSIRRITPSIPEINPSVTVDTVHFHSVSDMDDIIDAGQSISLKSGLEPKDYQWRAFCFSCFNNILLCLPTGMGKTLIAVMLLKANRKRNESKAQVFIVPTVVLVEQQASAIEKTTDLKVVRRSSANLEGKWSEEEVCVCTPAMLVNAIKKNEISMSHLSLLIFDEVHEANSPKTAYGQLLFYLSECPASQRPRVLGLTASPCSNSSNMREDISALCNKLGAVPYNPLQEDSIEKPNSVTCRYVTIYKTKFEMEYENFVITSLTNLSELHDFFKANRIYLPVTLNIQSKINEISRVISNSQFVAIDLADVQLMQLTTWMSKWLDSLNILQILGPAKLVQFIREEFAYATKNPALSQVSSHIGAIIDQLRQSAEKIFMENEIAENSQKVTELLTLLKNHGNKHERILIFTERRNTAERLCRRLKEDPYFCEMKPNAVMGYANCGKAFMDMQQSVLKKFQSGECKLLVATSVLEQGIDVAMCGLVICFDGVKSVKSVIQARGRARKDASIFVAFVTTEYQQKTNKIAQEEVAMNLTISQLMKENQNCFDASIREELDKFLLSDRRYEKTCSDRNYESDDDETEDEIPSASDRKTVKLRFLHFVNSMALVNHIESYDRVRITKKYIDAYFTVSTDGEACNIIQKISTSTSDRTTLRSWIEIDNCIFNWKQNDFQDAVVTFDILTGFYFEDHTTVTLDSNMIWTENIEFHIRKNELKICVNNRNFILQANYIDTLLINETTNSFEIYLCLRHPPEFFNDNELANFDFQTRSFNLCLQRKTSLDCSLSWKLREAFQSLCPKVYNVCHLRKSTQSFDQRNNSNRKQMDFMLNYAVNVWHSTHSALLPPVLPSHIMARFSECSSLISLQLLLNNTTPIRFQKLQIERIKDFKLPFTECEGHPDYVSVCRVNVTPTRFIYLPMQSVQKNRVFRYFPDPKDFLLVSFTDESGGNPWRSSRIHEWFLNVLEKGIQIGERHFTFLGCSNSQLREGRVWFSTLDREDVYKKIGDFPEDWSAGRKLTRLALAFASSTQTVALDHKRYLLTVADDVEKNGVNFSDGIGKASNSLVEKLQSALNLPQKPSAFQIRVGGIKGVISLFQQDDDVTFRKSMKKFESSHNILEVLNYSRSLPLYLNRQVILLLSNFGISDNTFLEMQHNMLVKCMDTFVEQNSSIYFVKSHSNIFDWELFPSEHIVREPFFRQMLFSNASDLIAGITNHSHIPVSDGRILMGVLDETGTLEYGEVYAHIVEDNFDYEVDGRVVVFRNPCVLPSDIRLLNARKADPSSRLRELYTNCLVLPSQGPSSHASECSGGDLDGDLYYVIWDVNLIPPNLQVPGDKVVEVKSIEKQPSQTCNSAKSMMQFYCDYASKNQLGIIANAHLATADEYGIRHDRSVKLAKYVTAETDAPKKGYTVGRIPSTLLPSRYPDFMQKSDKPSYRSQTILGKLFRQSKPILEILLEKRNLCVGQSKVRLTGDEASIENLYTTYCYEIKTLLKSFDLKCEVDLFSGTPVWEKDYLAMYKQQHQLRHNVLANVKIFWQKWKRIFDKWRSDHLNNQQKLLEWYVRPKSSPWPFHSFSFLAMPYVDLGECTRKTISQKIFDSTIRWITQNKLRWLNEWRMRFSIGKTVMNKLGGSGSHLYGSSVLGLNEEHSDIDVCADNNNFEQISSALREIDQNVETVKKPSACVKITCETLKIEVTNFTGGVRKTYAFGKLFDENRGYWPALRVLIEWARKARIVKSCGSEGIMTVVGFSQLFIHMATAAPLNTQIEPTPFTLNRFGNWIDSSNESQCGRLIYDFLKKLSSRDCRVWLMTKFDPLSNEPLIKSDLIDELCKNAEIAICILSVHDGNVQKLFEFCTKKRLFRLDKRYIITDATKDLCLKELKSICNPKKIKDLDFELTERNGIYYVEVSGDHNGFKDVEKGINQINIKIMSTRSQQAPRKESYHVSSATMLIVEFGNGVNSHVSFSPYDDDSYHARHIGILKLKLILRNTMKNLNWRESEYQRYENRFLKQMDLFLEKQRTIRKTSRYRRFSGQLNCVIRCGNHYFFHVPDSLQNTFETISLENVEEKIANMEESLELERQANIIADLKVYNSLTLMQSSDQKGKDANPLVLVPLNELKLRSRQQPNESILRLTTSNNLNGIRHSFYTIWKDAASETRNFALRNGFKEIPIDWNDYCTNVEVSWRKHGLSISCDKLGRITEINHRKVRWLSATLNSCEETKNGDVRIYLENKGSLDEDESCVNAIIEYLNNRSIFEESFAKQLEDYALGNTVTPLSTKPLIPTIFDFNWRFRSMRVLTPILKFENADKDGCILNAIYDGIFQGNKNEFEWFPKHVEFEIRLANDYNSPEKLCKKSFDFGLKLFDFLK